MEEAKARRIVGNWIFLGVAMLIIQVLLGGITRLTGSGLSITEWKPIMGALPPMTEGEWQKAFDQYQQIAQYKYLNNHFSLGDFKFIFFWEWFHRLWARFIGIVFLIPFIWFLVKKYFQAWMIGPLVNLFLLGALQGALGWIMVKSGLNDADLYVNHIRLSIHFLAAMLLIGYALIFGMSIRTERHDMVVNSGLKQQLIWLILLLCVQLMYGAFMAGLKAANTAPTWPDINGSLYPANSITDLSSIFHNKFAIHFIHRTLAYILGIWIIIWWWKAKQLHGSALFNRMKTWPLLLVLLQIVLGIASVLTSPNIVLGKFGLFEWMAQLHQLTGMLLLMSLLALSYILRRKPVF